MMSLTTQSQHHDQDQPIQVCTGLAALAPSYDAFIMDLWGVIHDGVTVFDGVIECLLALKKANKPVLFLSNAPRPAAVIIRQLTTLGVPRDLYADVFSSGQDAHNHLFCRRDPWYARLGRGCYHIGAPRDMSIFESLDLERVEDPAAADFILNTGPWRDNDTVSAYKDILQSGAKAGVPMICCNPDREVIRGTQRMICAGALADYYENLGGFVRYHGKPDPSIYAACLEKLGQVPSQDVLVIGDSLATDIAGARAAQLHSLLIAGGLHGQELGLKKDAPIEGKNLQRLCRERGHIPDYALPHLVW